MQNFTIYLVKSDFNTNERYQVNNDKVIENKKSIFNDGVTSLTAGRVKEYISKKKIDRKVITRADSPYNVFYRKTDNHKPWWKTFWEISDDLKNKSTDLLIYFTVQGRCFIAVHGHGRYLINPYCYEYDFGLRTALNVVEKEKIKSADIFTPSEIALKTRKQSGKSTKIDDYEFSVQNSLLKRVTGSVEKEFQIYFKKIGGAESIQFEMNGEYKGLILAVEKLFAKYESEAYKTKGFKWIDNFQIVRDKVDIERFNEKLLQQINAQKEGILLIPPESLEDKSYVSYKIKGIGRHKQDYSPILEIHQYYSELKKKNKFVNLDDLKNKHKIVEFDGNAKRKNHYPVYLSLYYDFTENDSHYFLEDGVWYSVDTFFYSDISKKIKELLENSRTLGFSYDTQKVTLEASKQNKHKEFIFNENLTSWLKQSCDAELLDSNLVNQTEVCDVIFNSKENIVLLHNKYKYASSALSHLFSQGYVSARRLTVQEFRKKTNSKITINSLKFTENDNFPRENYTVAYGIFSKKNNKGEFDIPLFSMINLSMFYDNLKELGYKVELIYFEVI